MRLHRYFIALLSVVTAVAAQDEEDPDPPAPTPTGIDTFANVTAYQPDDDSTQLTAVRTETLPNNTVLAAWSESSSVGNISIYRSTNNGYSWYPFGSAKSNSKKKLLQPHLLYVNGSYGEDENVVLLAVNAVDDKSTAIELFVSNDLGKTFELVSEVAKGGPLSNIATAVANPFLLLKYALLISDGFDTPRRQKKSSFQLLTLSVRIVATPYLSSTPVKATKRTRRKSSSRRQLTTTRAGAPPPTS